MKKRVLLISIVLGSVIFTQKSSFAQGPQNAVIQEVFNKYTQEEGVHNAFFRLESAKGEALADLVYGEFASGAKVTVNTPFYTASIGKTFTATAVAMLVEEGKISFQDRVVDHLGDLVKVMHVIDGEDFTPSLTIHHLLSHTSGLSDCFEDEPKQGANMMQLLFTEPQRFWRPQELVTFSKENFTARFKPGEGYHYTDTEYILLGLIVEKVSGLKLHEYFEKHIIKPLSLDLTSMNLRSEPTGKPDFDMAEIYAGPMEISSLRSLSADWAGGGIRSTGKDLNRFLQALLTGDLVREDTRIKMQQWVDESQGTYYGYGLRKWVLNELSPSWPALTLIGHSGSTGAFMYYCPELDLYLSGTFNNTDYLQQHIVFIAEILIAVSKNSK